MDLLGAGSKLTSNQYCMLALRLDSMFKSNPKCRDYYEEYQKIIEAYNQENDRENIYGAYRFGK